MSSSKWIAPPFQLLRGMQRAISRTAVLHQVSLRKITSKWLLLTGSSNDSDTWLRIITHSGGGIALFRATHKWWACCSVGFVLLEKQWCRKSSVKAGKLQQDRSHIPAAAAVLWMLMEMKEGCIKPTPSSLTMTLIITANRTTNVKSQVPKTSTSTTNTTKWYEHNSCFEIKPCLAL